MKRGARGLLGARWALIESSWAKSFRCVTRVSIRVVTTKEGGRCCDINWVASCNTGQSVMGLEETLEDM